MKRNVIPIVGLCAVLAVFCSCGKPVQEPTSAAVKQETPSSSDTTPPSASNPVPASEPDDGRVEIFAEENESGLIILGEDDDYIYMMRQPVRPGPTTLTDIADCEIQDDVMMRKCKKIELTNLSGTAEPVSVGVGESFLGLTVTEIDKIQYLVENQWVDYNVVVTFSGVLPAVSGWIYPGEVWTIFRFDEASYDVVPAIRLVNNPAAKQILEDVYYPRDLIAHGEIGPYLEYDASNSDWVKCEADIKDYTIMLLMQTDASSVGEVVRINGQEIISDKQ